MNLLSTKSLMAGLALGLFTYSARAQFETATVTVHAEAQSFLDTLHGNGTLGESGGSGAYPLYLGSAKANQTISSSSVFADAQLGLELSPTGLSASGSAHAKVEIADDTIAATCSSLSSIAVEFTIAKQMVWKIPSGHATSTNAVASINLLRGDTTLFSYSGDILNASGVIEPGTYTLLVHAHGESNFDQGGTAADASYALEFQLDPIWYCVADLTGDNVVDDSDFVIFINAYDVLDCADPAMPAGCPADLNGDLSVDDADFSIFVVAYDALVCP